MDDISVCITDMSCITIDISCIITDMLYYILCFINIIYEQYMNNNYYIRILLIQI